MSDFKVTVYSSPSCIYCRLAKEFFTEKNIEFEDKDVSEDKEAAQKVVEEYKSSGVPVIVIAKSGKEEVLIGFQQDKIIEILGLEK